jgi:hypothetical protein
MPIAVLLAVMTVSCTANPVRVGVAFDNDWRVGRETLTAEEQAQVKAATLQAVRHAFRGFDVTVREGRSGDHRVVVDSGYSPELVSGGQPAPVGETLPFALASRVHFEEVIHALFSVVECSDLEGCRKKSRSELVEALGRGIGGTAAHELGHQVGFRFAADVPCAPCYDGRTAQTYEHFFGEQHWSDAALPIMRRVLPTRRE